MKFTGKDAANDSHLLVFLYTMSRELQRAILAVAIGGNNLGGGKFKISGSIIGAYVIQMLTITLYAMKVSSTDVKAYKAIVIIILVVIGSPVVKKKFAKFMSDMKAKKANKSEKGAA